MTCFYDFFLNSRDPVDALHLTRAVMRDHPRWSHPYYWAPFVLIGR